MHTSDIHVYTIDGPGDVSGLRDLMESGTIEPRDIQGVMITHEGDLSANEFAMLEVAGLLSERMNISRREIVDTIPIQALAGANAFMVPHTVVFVRKAAGEGTGEKRFVVGGRCTRKFEPSEIGTTTYIREIRDIVRLLMAEADVQSPSDVHLVFAKTPWPNPDRYANQSGSLQKFVATDWWGMLQYAQGGAAIGVAMALGEIDEGDVTNERIIRDKDKLYSTVAQCSSTEDRDSVAVTLFANSARSASGQVIGHGVLEDGMDTEGVKRILRTMGFEFDCCPSSSDLERIRYGWLKPKTSETSMLRGHRHTLTTQSLLGPFWWMVEKGPIHAVVASVLGTTVLEVATGREHQGPIGKPLLAILADA